MQEISEGVAEDTEFGMAYSKGRYKNVGIENKVVTQVQKVYRDKNENGVDMDMQTFMIS